MTGQAVGEEGRGRGVRVNTPLGLAPRAVGERHPPAKPRAYALLVAWGRVSIDGVGIRRVAEVKPRDLDSLTGDVREAVEDPVRVLNDVDRQAREGVTLRGRLEPEEDAALDRELGRELRRELRHPCAGRDDEVLRVKRSGRRPDADAAVGRFPALDRLVETEHRAVLLGKTDMRLDRALPCPPAGPPFAHALPAV